jgi:hypothetical protein
VYQARCVLLCIYERMSVGPQQTTVVAAIHFVEKHTHRIIIIIIIIIFIFF